MNKKHFCLFVGLAIFLASCTSHREKYISEITALEKSIVDPKTHNFDQKKADELTKAYVSFAEKFGKDTLCPTYLFKAGEMYINMLQYQLAIGMMDRVMKDFPDYRQVPMCLFYKGYIYDDKIKDYKNAEKYYMEFLKKYPNHAFAPSAAALLKNLGKSPEELIREFEAQNKEKDVTP